MSFRPINASDIIFNAVEAIEKAKTSKDEDKIGLIFFQLRQQLTNTTDLIDELSTDFKSKISKLSPAELQKYIKVIESIDEFLTASVSIKSTIQKKAKQVALAQISYLQQKEKEFAEKETKSSVAPMEVETTSPIGEVIDLSKLLEILKKSVMTPKDLKEISATIKGNYNILYSSIGLERIRPLDEIKSRCSPDMFLRFVEEMINNTGNLNPANFNKFKEFLFYRTGPVGKSAFEQIMSNKSIEDANKLFDKIMSLLEREDLNAPHTDRQIQVLDYAFSSKRYYSILLNDSDISETMVAHFDEARTKCTSEQYLAIVDRLRSKPAKFGQWQALRMGSSFSLFRPTTIKDTGIACWKEAEMYTSQTARKHSSSKERFRISNMIEMHKRLAVAELQELAGLTRNSKAMPPENKDVKTGTWKMVFCLPNFLRVHLIDFEEWINFELTKCDKGEKNPIILAAQAYQRVVSYHPFANGNGRVARLVMDYIFERYHIPPIIMGRECLDGVFPLNQVPNQEDFLNKVLKQVYASWEEFNQLARN